MLDISFSTELIKQVWNSLPDKSQLPYDHEEFFSKSGAAPTSPDSRRQHIRIRARSHAILAHANKIYGIYTLDVSPNGVGLITPVQILPCERVELRSDKCDTLSLEVQRCRRLGPRSYECGCAFIKGPMNTIAYKQLLDQLRD